ncbi:MULTISPECIES: isochorismatase family protein [unclassified Pseudomonas]|uniref:isochorismatase family protein n=1 Tax=unclassified Pseudomonas TaxID=196821 RepID=UPI0015A1A148|nr:MULTISPECIES: isochorismatase family protein [unclassified Pseudomonas]NWA32625.1 isochorismatase family protein [Pseudomonas sp. C6002]NWB63995.1 isochorismatase family protein [Pseudomonas sp. F1002]
MTTAAAPANFNGHKPVIDASDTAMLLIDHQSGLFQIVKDMDVPQLRANAIALARAATLLNIPVITTASVPQGPNGPLIPEIQQAAPHAQYVARKGEINAWDNPEFHAAVKATGKKTLVIAGTLTSVCLAFPSISAVYEGYKVFAVVDASGNHSKLATDLTIARLSQAGVVPIDIMATLSELQGSWNRPDAEQWAQVYTQAMPHYQLLIESYLKAQQVATEHEVLDSQR